MMEGAKYFLVAVLLVGVVRCQQTFQEVVPNDLTNPDRCYDSQIDAFFSVGSVWWRPAQCNRLTCQRSADAAFLNINGVRCEQITEVPTNCKLTKSNLVALFPACCPKLVCFEMHSEDADIPKPISASTGVADKEPINVQKPAPVNEESAEDSFVKPALNEENVNAAAIDKQVQGEMMQEENKETAAQEATENGQEPGSLDAMAEEPAVVLGSSPGEEIIPASMTINVVDESAGNIFTDKDSVSHENMNDDAKKPVKLEMETKIPEAGVEETKLPQVMAEEAKLPEAMAEETKLPAVMDEKTKLPEVMDEEAKLPEAMDEEAKLPEAMDEEAKLPEVIEKEAKLPEVIEEEAKLPEAIEEEAKLPEAMDEKAKLPEVIENETKLPEVIEEEAKLPEAIEEEAKLPAVMDEEIKLPEVMQEEAPPAQEEQPMAPAQAQTIPAILPEMPTKLASMMVPDKLAKPVQPIYNGGVGLGKACGPPTYQSCSSYLECRNKICQYPANAIPTQHSMLVGEAEKPSKAPAKEDSLVNTAEKPVEDIDIDTEIKVEEIPQATEESTAVVEEKPLLPGYERHATGDYKFNKRMVTWARAKAICEAEGANLAVINSDEESKILMKMFDRYPENYWQPKYRKIVFASIGFSDLEREGEYKTVFGKPLSSTGYLKFWRKDEPNNLGASKSRPGEDCGALHRNGGLNDFFCTLHVPFICEH